MSYVQVFHLEHETQLWHNQDGISPHVQSMHGRLRRHELQMPGRFGVLGQDMRFKVGQQWCDAMVDDIHGFI